MIVKLTTSHENITSTPLEVTLMSVTKKADWYGFFLDPWTSLDSYLLWGDHNPHKEVMKGTLEEIDAYLNTIEK